MASLTWLATVGPAALILAGALVAPHANATAMANIGDVPYRFLDALELGYSAMAYDMLDPNARQHTDPDSFTEAASRVGLYKNPSRTISRIEDADLQKILRSQPWRGFGEVRVHGFFDVCVKEEFVSTGPAKQIRYVHLVLTTEWGTPRAYIADFHFSPEPDVACPV